MDACSLACLQLDFLTPIGVRIPCLRNGAAYTGLCLPIPVRQPSIDTSTGQPNVNSSSPSLGSRVILGCVQLTGKATIVDT